MNIKSKFDPFNIFIGLLGLVVLIIIGFLGNLLFNKSFNISSALFPKQILNNQPSSSINDLAQPQISTKNIKGTISRINGDSITIKSLDNNNQSVNISINPNTIITSPAIFAPQTNTTNESQAPVSAFTSNTKTLSVNDLKQNDTVECTYSIVKNSDGIISQATTIVKYIYSNSITGSVESVSGNTIKIKLDKRFSSNFGQYLTPNFSSDDNYQIKVSPNTHILMVVQGTSTKANVDQIKSGMTISAISNTSIDGTSINASLINIVE